MRNDEHRGKNDDRGYPLIDSTPENRRSSDLRPCDSGHIHLALKVCGIAAMIARMEQEGFIVAGPVQRVGAQGLAASYLCGFDQFVIELLEDAAPAS